MVWACKLKFSIGFERCKEMAQMHLPTDSTGFLQMDSLDSSLKVVISHCLEKIVKAFDSLVGTNKVDSAI